MFLLRSPRAEADLLKPEVCVPSVGGGGSCTPLDRVCGPTDLCPSQPQSERVELSSSLHLPHWLTSNKSDMDGSQLSLPDLKYPPWVQCCDHTGSLCEDQGTDRQWLIIHAFICCPSVLMSSLSASGPEAPSWVSELEDEDSPGLSQVIFAGVLLLPSC